MGRGGGSEALHRHLRFPRRGIGLPGGLRLRFGGRRRRRHCRSERAALRCRSALARAAASGAGGRRRAGTGGGVRQASGAAGRWRLAGVGSARAGAALGAAGLGLRRARLGADRRRREGCRGRRIAGRQRLRLDRDHDRRFGMVEMAQGRGPPQRRGDEHMQADRQGKRCRRHAPGLRPDETVVRHGSQVLRPGGSLGQPDRRSRGR